MYGKWRMPAHTNGPVSLWISIRSFEQCPAGSYNPTLGASSNASCIGCAAGKANPVPGSVQASTCLDCLPGFSFRNP